MLEAEGTKTFLGMTGEEWHALYGGFRSGLRIWEVKHSTVDDIQAMKITDALKKDYLEKFHYFQIGEDLPLYFALAGVGIYLVAHGQIDFIMKTIGGLVGIPIPI